MQGDKAGELAVSGADLFEGILEAAPDAIVIVDQRGHIRIVNGQTEALFGYRRDELIGQAVELLVPESLRPGHVGHRARYLADAQTRPMGAALDLHVHCKDGTDLPVEISLSPLTVAGETLVVSIIRDTSERRQLLDRERTARLQAEMALRIRDQVLGTVSHDLRTPLATIALFARLLRDEAGPHAPGARRDEWAEKIAAAAQEGLTMIGELLDVARLGMGEPLELERETMDLVSLAGEAVAERQEKAPQHQIELESSAPEIPGRWDRTRLKRVLANLLSNAIKYSAVGSTVWVNLSTHEAADGTRASVTVRDEGVGIPHNELSEAFEWYFRGTNVGGLPGTGIGLAGARRIVELHGGTISVSSTEGSGSTFTVDLPTALG